MQFAPGAYTYAAIPLLASVPAIYVHPLFGVALFAVGVAVLAFYRDPERHAPPNGFVAPADGKITVIDTIDDRVRVGVFMNVTDVHVNRAPAPGTVTTIEHRPGANKPAFSKDSDRNERVRIETDEWTVVLIAGWFARRIHPYVENGDELVRGDRIGHISFGSRADVILPESVSLADVVVENGARVRAGESLVVTESSDEGSAL